MVVTPEISTFPITFTVSLNVDNPTTDKAAPARTSPVSDEIPATDKSEPAATLLVSIDVPVIVRF